MTDEFTPYHEYQPGDLITAEDENNVQVLIKKDIAKQVGDTITHIRDNVKVKAAENADKLANKTLEQITKEIVDAAVAAANAARGYKQYFKRLEVGKELVIKHDLKAYPLVDVYQLDYFEVVVSEDDDRYISWVNFYLYNSSESRIRYKADTGGAARNVEISSKDQPGFRISFQEALDLFGVEVSDESSLSDLEGELWKAINADQPGQFDDWQHAHSPWFDRCCREETTVGDVKRKKEWDDIWLKIKPRKTINYPFVGEFAAGDNRARLSLSVPATVAVQPAPTQIQVAQYDFNTIGVTLLTPPIHPPEVLAIFNNEDATKEPEGAPTDRNIDNELKVLVLLRV